MVWIQENGVKREIKLNNEYGKEQERSCKHESINPIATRNRKAMKNGKLAEALACGFIQGIHPDSHVEFLNRQLDYLVDNQYIEVKSCQKWIESTNGQSRRGLFCLEAGQHKYLCQAKGVYLFMVMNRQREVVRLRFMSSWEVSFQKQITWTKIFPLISGFKVISKGFVEDFNLMDTNSPFPPEEIKGGAE